MKTCASPRRSFQCWDKRTKARTYLRQAEEVKAGINSHLFNGKFYLARTDRKEMFPLASAWALRFDIEPAADKSKILAAIEKAGKPNIGGYGGDAFYSGLLNAGGGDFVVRDLARYRPMLEENKANWESFGFGAEVEPRLDLLSGVYFSEIHSAASSPPAAVLPRLMSGRKRAA